MQARTRAKNTAKQRAGLAFRLKAVQVLAMSEPDVARLIFRLERDSLFQKLSPFIRREAVRASRFYLPLKEEAARADYGFDWSAYAREMALIKKIGRAGFEKYFLYGDIGYTLEEIVARTGLSLREAKQVKGFVFAVSLQEHVMPNSPYNGGQVQRYTCAARVAVSGGKPVLSWLLPQLARGAYVVDLPALRGFQVENLTAEEAARLPELLGEIKLVNARQSAVRRLVELVAKVQHRFLVSGEAAELVTFTASDAARALKVYPSTVSRAVCGHSILVPDGSELALASLLPNQREIAINAIARILESTPAVTDKELADRLSRKHRIRLSRRGVNECRRAAVSK